MRFLKQALLLAALSLSFISCADEVTNNYYEGAAGYFDVNILSAGAEVFTYHKSYLDPEYVSQNYIELDYQIGVKITLKIDDPSKRESINRLLISYGNYGYSFTKDELKANYVDSIGGYVLELSNIGRIGGSSYILWNITLYDIKNNSSNGYPLVTEINPMLAPSSLNDWSSPNNLEVALSPYYVSPSAGAKVETHFLNTNYEEVGAASSVVSNSKWIADNVPAEAVYFYYIITDKPLNTERIFVSGKYTVKDRLPLNVEFISGVDTPTQIEYLSGIDKILTLSSSTSELILLNYDDNSIVWKKKLGSIPSAFAYSHERGAIYLGYSNGAVDSVNPADGSSKQLYACGYGIRVLIPAENYLLTFTQSSSYYGVFNLNNKELSSNSNYYFYYIYKGFYDSISKKIYLRNDDEIYSFKFNAANGGITAEASAYFSSSSEIYRTFVLSSDRSKIYLGEGISYNLPNGQSSSFISSGSMSKFCDMRTISDSYLATITPEVNDGYSITQSAVSVYNSSLVLQGKITGLAGTPKKIFNKGNNLKIYSIQSSGRLITQKYTVDEILAHTNKVKAKRKAYTMTKL